MTNFTIEIDDRAVREALANLSGRASNMSPAMRAIARHLRGVTEQAFAAERSPFGTKWKPLEKSTLKARRDGGASAKILQDSGQLAASITATSDATSATLAAGKQYAAIHQFGGRIDYAPRSIRVRLRTDRKGSLLKNGNLAIFAKDRHKMAVTRWGESQGWSVLVPARPFLPVDRQGNLTPNASRAVVDILRAYILRK